MHISPFAVSLALELAGSAGDFGIRRHGSRLLRSDISAIFFVASVVTIVVKIAQPLFLDATPVIASADIQCISDVHDDLIAQLLVHGKKTHPLKACYFKGPPSILAFLSDNVW